MKAILLALFLVVTTVLVAGPALATDYFVIKSRSGILKVVNHQPKGGATIVKGPFKTFEEAKNAMKETKAPDTKQ
ncbi:MAG: hypothetical protein M1511_14780 [Deltaproteobacteria bacterium]|nr:hypothetical protein [Deltaproteobacteria bacterium]